MMATTMTMQALAAQAGVTIDDRKDSGRSVACRLGKAEIEHELVLTAPDGQTFDGDVHERILRYGAGRVERVRVLAAAVADIATLRPCEIPDCEWCAGE